MKKILTLIVASMLALSSQSFAKDFGNYSVDIEVGGAYDAWDPSTGENLNSSRFAGYLNLDLGYRFNDNFSILSENAVVEVEDDVHTLDYSTTLTLTYEINDFDFNIGGSATDTDNDRHAEGNQQTSYAIYELGYTYPGSGVRVAYKYDDELSGGSVNDSNVRYVENIQYLTAEKTFAAPLGIGKDLVVELTYADADNYKKVYTIDMEHNLTENYGYALAFGENDGQGLFANNTDANRDWASARVFVKY